jgi:hypothetical protein
MSQEIAEREVLRIKVIEVSYLWGREVPLVILNQPEPVCFEAAGTGSRGGRRIIVTVQKGLKGLKGFI